MNDITEWKCLDGCRAECCGVVPIPIQTYNTFKRKIKKHIIDIMKFKGNIILMTEDMSCAFLNDDHKCSIYGHRPMTCKLYGTIKELECPYINVYGYKRTEDEIIKTKDFIKLQNKIRMDILKL